MALVIFDCDGVLVESEAILIDTELELLAARGVRYERSDYMKQFMGLSNAAFKAKLERQLANLGKTNEVDVPSFFREHDRVAKERMRLELEAVSGAKEAITSMPYELCVASSSLPSELTWKLTHTGLSVFFEPYSFSTALVDNGKPAPDLFLYAARQMGVDPAECVVIEDSANGVTAARRAKMRCVGFTAASHCTPDHGETLREHGADVIVESYSELPSALRSMLG